MTPSQASEACNRCQCGQIAIGDSLLAAVRNWNRENNRGEGP